jgi:hypothetical protein
MRSVCVGCIGVNVKMLVQTRITFALLYRSSIFDCLLSLAVVGRIRFVGTDAFVSKFDCIVKAQRLLAHHACEC